MSLFRKVELMEEPIIKTDEKITAEGITEPSISINEKLIKIIENIVERYIENKKSAVKIKSKKSNFKKPTPYVEASIKTIIPKKKSQSLKHKVQNGGNIKWIY